MKEVVNNQARAIPLEDGTVLAAAGTPGSVRTVADLAETDQRLVDRGLIGVRDMPLKAVPAVPKTDSGPATEKEKK